MLRIGSQAYPYVYLFMLSDCSRQLQGQERSFCYTTWPSPAGQVGERGWLNDQVIDPKGHPQVNLRVFTCRYLVEKVMFQTKKSRFC